MKVTITPRDCDKVNQIVPIMQAHLGPVMNLARIKLLAFVLHALCIVQTVSLHKIASAMPTGVERDSNLRRLQRFLAGYALSLDLIAIVIFALLPVKTGLVLSLDRTNWKFGDVNINILMLGVTYKGVAFPLLFTMLDKRGNSNWKERTRLIDRFIRLFGAECIDSLVADREFVGKQWVGYLNNRRIRYCLRIKQNFWLRNPKSSEDVRAWHLFHGLRLGQERVYDKLFLLKGEYVYIAGAMLKNSDGVPELQILICYNRPEAAVATYRQRWQIETPPARHRPHRASYGDGLHGIGMGVSRWRTQGYECESCQDKTRQESQIAGKVWPGRNRKHIPQTALQAEIRCLQIFVMYLDPQN